MGYCSTADAFRMAGITTSEISDADMAEFVKDAEIEVNRLTFTTYWSEEDNGTVTSATDNTLTITGKTWTADVYIGDYVWIYGGTGANQLKKISDNDATSITIDEDWDTNPSTDSTIRIIHSADDPRKILTDYPGKGTTKFFVPKYPVIRLNSVTIRTTDITPSTIRVYPGGSLLLTTDAETQIWTQLNDPGNDIDYWFGVYPVPREVKTLTALKTALFALNAQMGQTHNIPSGYTLPEGSVTIGQAYVNIRGTVDVLQKRHDELISIIRKYPMVVV